MKNLVFIGILLLSTAAALADCKVENLTPFLASYELTGQPSNWVPTVDWSRHTRITLAVQETEGGVLCEANHRCLIMNVIDSRTGKSVYSFPVKHFVESEGTTDSSYRELWTTHSHFCELENSHTLMSHNRLSTKRKGGVLSLFPRVYDWDYQFKLDHHGDLVITEKVPGDSYRKKANIVHRFHRL